MSIGWKTFQSELQKTELCFRHGLAAKQFFGLVFISCAQHALQMQIALNNMLSNDLELCDWALKNEARPVESFEV